MCASASKYNIPIVKTVHVEHDANCVSDTNDNSNSNGNNNNSNSRVLTIDDFLSQIKHQQGIEGCVLRFEDNGTMYKVKTEW